MSNTTLRDARKLVVQVADLLGSRIVAGVYGDAGELPSQGDLCRELGVSRPVIREAMRQLESRGLLQIAQGMKPRVKPAGPDVVVAALRDLLSRRGATLAHLVELRRPLEAAAAALAAERATPAHLAGLDAEIEAQETAPDLAGQVAADSRFHRLLADAAGNPLFGLMLDILSGALEESRSRSIGRVGVGPAVRGHRAVLAAVRARDPSAASAAMLAHVDEARLDLDLD